MARGGWGGGIEMAACAHLKRVNVWVYEANKKQVSNPNPNPNLNPPLAQTQTLTLILTLKPSPP